MKIFLVENYRRQGDIYSASLSKAQSYTLLRVPNVSNRLFNTVLVTGQYCVRRDLARSHYCSYSDMQI